jgi:methionyl-tRNA formyltransferase
MNEKRRIVFMGTPGFAVPALEALHRAGSAPLLVVTQPDRPSGRGRRVSPSPVKSAALALGNRVVQPENMREAGFREEILRIDPDFLVVVAFGHILPAKILLIPAVGSINIHASLLPKYRGAAPIQWALINDEKETGVTTMWMDSGIDTGDILLARKAKILPGDDAAVLQDRLANLGADLLLETLEGVSEGTLKPKPQNNEEATYAPLLRKEDGRLDWKRPAAELVARIRGMTPWPGAFTFSNENRIKVLRATALSGDAQAVPGTVLCAGKDGLKVASGKGIVSIIEIQASSGKALQASEFLRGFRLPPGAILA